MSPETFEREMDKLAAAYGETPTPARVAVYLADLGTLDDATFVAACARARREYPYKFPPIATLLGYARDLDIAAGRRFDGAAAWARIERQILARYPDYRGEDWPSRLANEVFYAECGLPFDVARLESEYDRRAKRDRFIAAFAAALPPPAAPALAPGRGRRPE